MLDIGWSELVIIGVVALIVIGPKDLPEMFRTLGRFTGKLRSMARDFQRAMDNAADQSGVKGVAKDLKSATSAKSLGLDAVKDAAAKFEKWDPLKSAPKPPVPAAAAPAPAEGPAYGSATEAVRAQAAERRAILDEAAQKLRATQTPAPVPAPVPAGPALVAEPAPKGDA